MSWKVGGVFRTAFISSLEPLAQCAEDKKERAARRPQSFKDMILRSIGSSKVESLTPQPVYLKIFHDGYVNER